MAKVHSVRAAPRPAEARAVLVARLGERRAEIEAGILTRIESDEGPMEAADPEYAAGLRGAIPTALQYCLTEIENAEANPPPVPTALLSQARVAARNGVGLDTVLRRYFAGYTLLGDFLIEEAEAVGLPRGAELKRLSRSLAAAFDRLLAAVSEEHAREEKSVSAGSSEERRATRIQRLLAGEPLEGAELGYDLSAHHLGAIAKGPGAVEEMRELARRFDRRLLSLRRPDEALWAWLGGREPLDPDELRRHLAASWTPKIRLALGEPAEGLGGWRLTHRQASAALPIATRGTEPVVRYADVALVASLQRDELLATSLRELYLTPLEDERDGGTALRQTLRAYFAAERNISSTALALGVSRRTVENRLRVVEQRLNGPLKMHAVEMEVALRLK